MNPAYAGFFIIEKTYYWIFYFLFDRVRVINIL